MTACRECSLLLSHFPRKTLSSRAGLLIVAYQKRAAKWHRVSPWSEEELQELGYGMQTQVRRALVARSIYVAKLRNLDLIERGKTSAKRADDSYLTNKLAWRALALVANGTSRAAR